jgi:hypothetical protein
MVIGVGPNWLSLSLLAAEEAAEPLIEQLDPPRRAAVLMAILGLVLLGLALVACAMIGGRWVRRLARERQGPTTLTAHVENQRLRTALEPILPAAGDTAETKIIRRTSDQTIADG